MAKQIAYIAIVLVVIVSGVYLCIHNAGVKSESKALYEKSHLTEADLKTEASFSACSIDETDEQDGLKVRYKKLYGVVHIDDFKIDANGGIKVELLSGNPAKILILDKTGNERFYNEVSELDFEPGEAGKYEVYLVGNKFTGKIEFSTY